MTIYLENTSETKTISLRYGEGNNFMLQLNPKCSKPVPKEITKQKLQSYLYLFRDLKVIEDSEPVKVDEEIEDNNQPEGNETNNQPEGNETNNQPEGDETNNQPEGDEDSGESVDENGDETNNQPEGDEDSEEGDTSNPGNDGQSSTQSTVDAENGNGQSEQDDKSIYFTEKELNSLKAEQVKEVARTLGIEVTENSTKKALIPVILDKQGNIE